MNLNNRKQKALKNINMEIKLHETKQRKWNVKDENEKVKCVDLW